MKTSSTVPLRLNNCYLGDIHRSRNLFQSIFPLHWTYILIHSAFSLDPITGYLICYQQSQDGAKGMFVRSVRYCYGIFSIFQVFHLTFGNMESFLYIPNTGKVWTDHKETSLSPLRTSPLFQVQCQGDADHQVQPQQAGEINYWVESYRSWNWV